MVFTHDGADLPAPAAAGVAALPGAGLENHLLMKHLDDRTAPSVYHLDNGYWGVVIVLPGFGQHMRNDFESADEALDWVLGLQEMYDHAAA